LGVHALFFIPTTTRWRKRKKTTRWRKRKKRRNEVSETMVLRSLARLLSQHAFSLSHRRVFEIFERGHISIVVLE